MKTKNIKTKAAILTSTLIYLLFTTSYSLAQGIEQGIDLSIKSIPNEPQPGQPIALEAVSFGLDLNQATLTWVYGGKTVLSGYGKTRVTVTAPRAGASATVTVTASASGTAPVSASMVLSPENVSLLWEAVDATVPPFYKGRSLLAPNGLVRVVAMPVGGTSRQSIYQWERNDSAVKNASGVGQSSIVFKHELFNKQEEIGVRVYGGGVEGEDSIGITPRAPLVAVYQKKDGFIDYATGSTSMFSVPRNGAVIRFEPYFFTASTNLYDDLAFSISSEGIELFGDTFVNELRISSTDAPKQSRLSVSVSTQEYSLQNIKQNLTILFQ